jgi:vacuolar iron transporter family protein
MLVSIGLGGYLDALTDTKHYEVELARQERQVANSSELEMYRLFAEYGLGRDAVGPLARQLKEDPGA